MTLCYTLFQLAEKTGAELIGDPHLQIFDVADLESATFRDISFYANARYASFLQSSQAGAICISKEGPFQEGRSYLVATDPSKVFQQLIELFHPPLPWSGFEGIHPSAVVHATALVGKKVVIGPHVVVEAGAVIGEETCVGAGAFVGMECRIGRECKIHPHVVLRERSVVGDRVIIQPGAVIGGCGFGYLTDATGQHIKLNQTGNVVIEDDVEIGANTTIDRARFKSTRIGKGSKIDNLVQIAHGVEIGPHNLLVAQSGVSGSSSTGAYVVLAGQSGVVGHLHLDAGVVVAAKAGVTKNLTKGHYGGFPAMPLDEHHRFQAALRKLVKASQRAKKG